MRSFKNFSVCSLSTQAASVKKSSQSETDIGRSAYFTDTRSKHEWTVCIISADLSKSSPLCNCVKIVSWWNLESVLVIIEYYMILWSHFMILSTILIRNYRFFIKMSEFCSLFLICLTNRIWVVSIFIEKPLKSIHKYYS